MKSSNYNCCYPFEEGKMLLYNTRTNALAILDNSHFTSYEKFLRTGIIEDKNFEKNLEKGGYILEDNIEEIELLRNQMLRSRYNSTSLGLTIAATADCNFRCVYCYEKNSIKTSKMTLENQNAIIEFVKKQIKVLSHLHISWYGGEPLLAFDIIEYLSPQLIQLCKENDVTYVASIVTNGYLLTPDKARALKKYKVGNIQVTLDGSEEIHDRRRPLAGGQGTFKQIISNLKDCVDFFDTVNIRINTDKTNVSSISQVKEILDKNGILKDNVGIYLGYVEDHNDAYELEKCLHIDQFCDVNLKFVRDNHFNTHTSHTEI